MAKHLPGDTEKPSKPQPVAGKKHSPGYPVWCCPQCGQLAFGSESPFTCDYCGDAVTWIRWREPLQK